MPYPDSKYGPECVASNRVMLKIDLGASGVHYVPWERRCVVPMLRVAARWKAWNVEHPGQAYKVGPGMFQTFNCRDVTGGTTPSIHSWPLAVDINPFENPYVGSGAPAAHAIPDYVVGFFKKERFTWGGDWARPKDYMHLERKAWDGRTGPLFVDYREFLGEGEDEVSLRQERFLDGVIKGTKVNPAPIRTFDEAGKDFALWNPERAGYIVGQAAKAALGLDDVKQFLAGFGDGATGAAQANDDPDYVKGYAAGAAAKDQPSEG